MSVEIKSYSLRDYVVAAGKLDDLNDDIGFIQFMLTGRTTDREGQAIQAFVDVNKNRIGANQDISMARDFDSLIGISQNLLVSTPLSVYPVPIPAAALTSSIHLRWPVVQDDGEIIQTPIHRIPNLQLAAWLTRGQIHICFPSLATREGGQQSKPLTLDQLTQFYEVGLRPTIAELLPEDVSDWAPTYQAELFRAKKSSGHMGYQSKMIPGSHVRELGSTLRYYLSAGNIDWANDFFFLHTARGYKHATQHLTSRTMARLKLEEFCTTIGLEENVFEEAAQSRVVEEVLGIRSEDAVRITSLGSSKYSRDIVSHLLGVSGCRIEPGVRAAGAFEGVYFQLYSTDKALTYNPEGNHHGKFMSISEAMGVKQPAPFITGLQKLFVEAMDMNTSNARIEVRVPFRHACTVLTRFDSGAIQECMLGFRRTVWWNFRAHRLEAISRLLMKQAMGSPEFRVTSDALLLTAASVWLVNSLHARPDDGSAARDLMRAVLPLTDAVDPDPETLLFKGGYQATGGQDSDGDEDLLLDVPYNPYGAIFPRRIILNFEVPRMARDTDTPRTLPPKSFEYLFKGSVGDIEYRFHPVGIIPRGVQPVRRVVTNKTHRTRTFVESDTDPRDVNLFNLGSKGLSLPLPLVDDGSDMEVDDEQTNTSPDIDFKVYRIYRQFLVDMALKSSTTKQGGGPSYMKLNEEERVRVTEDLYNNLKLSDMWNEVFWKVGTPASREQVFRHLFPPKGHETSPKAQNYPTSQYYRDWKALCATADEETVEKIRGAIRKKVLPLKWLPFAGSDRMWNTSQKPKGFTRLPPRTSGPAPHILCREEPSWEED
ncbi:hypothetical protein BDP27DRAFT_1430481 [Rhodocollybia butyracea]|uniref:Uncharacterized protein n=1 Tax=Rhodocollybia butyracea TaxID=206335 RepID=A0A9P5PB09_9AGAR|nr:hypothetical protein BDP27DRAFT_1430481 [Rhodocollybia butyracea]